MIVNLKLFIAALSSCSHQRCPPCLDLVHSRAYSHGQPFLPVAGFIQNMFPYLRKIFSRSTGVSELLRNVVREDGFRALYRGVMPTLLGVVPYAGIAFSINEQAKHEASGKYLKSRRKVIERDIIHEDYQ